MAGHINPFQSWHLTSCSNVTQGIVTRNSNYIRVSQGHVMQTACLKANKMSHKTLFGTPNTASHSVRILHEQTPAFTQ